MMDRRRMIVAGRKYRAIFDGSKGFDGNFGLHVSSGAAYDQPTVTDDGLKINCPASPIWAQVYINCETINANVRNYRHTYVGVFQIPRITGDQINFVCPDFHIFLAYKNSKYNVAVQDSDRATTYYPITNNTINRVVLEKVNGVKTVTVDGLNFALPANPLKYTDDGKYVFGCQKGNNSTSARPGCVVKSILVEEL